MATSSELIKKVEAMFNGYKDLDATKEEYLSRLDRQRAIFLKHNPWPDHKEVIFVTREIAVLAKNGAVDLRKWFADPKKPTEEECTLFEIEFGIDYKKDIMCPYLK